MKLSEFEEKMARNNERLQELEDRVMNFSPAVQQFYLMRFDSLLLPIQLLKEDFQSLKLAGDSEQMKRNLVLRSDLLKLSYRALKATVAGFGEPPAEGSEETE